MQLTKKLLGYLNSVFDKDSRSFLAFRLRHVSDAFRWQVSERVLRGYDGDSELFVLQLDDYTIRTLIDHLVTIDGITIIGAATSDQLNLSAAALIDAEGRQAASNGDWVQAYTSILWAYYEALSVELGEAKRQIAEALRQMSVKTAEAEWLDEWGGYFGFPREEVVTSVYVPTVAAWDVASVTWDGEGITVGGETLSIVGPESDEDYAARIIAEVLRPRGNNKAIEIGLRDKFGQESRVIDLTRYGDLFPGYTGDIDHDGLYQHDANAVPYYGLFKITIGYDLLGGADISGYIQEVRRYVERLRDAGTHLESVELGGSALSDAFPYPPVDDSAAISVSADNFDETMTGSSDEATGVFVFNYSYSGVRSYGGVINHAGSGSDALGLS